MKKRFITSRGVIWLGQVCNQKCFFCYFRNILDNPCHPYSKFMPLEKAQKILFLQKEIYGITTVDIQGGEPTLYPEIHKLISFCVEIEVKPTLITNGLKLSSLSFVKSLKKAGLYDVLLSVHGADKVQDELSGVKGAGKLQRKALENLLECEIPVRINTVLTKKAFQHIEELAELLQNYKIKVWNLIFFNPFGWNDKEKYKENVPSYTEVGKKVEEIIKSFGDNMEINLRYFPLCAIKEEFRQHVYNFPQLPYDHWEWDYAAWFWAETPEQRKYTPEISPPPLLPPLEGWEEPYSLTKLIFKHQLNKEILYQLHALYRASKMIGYYKGEKCKECSLQRICDGFHKEYVDVYGDREAKPVKLGFSVISPTFYIENQRKVWY